MPTGTVGGGVMVEYRVARLHHVAARGEGQRIGSASLPGEITAGKTGSKVPNRMSGILWGSPNDGTHSITRGWGVVFRAEPRCFLRVCVG